MVLAHIEGMCNRLCVFPLCNGNCDDNILVSSMFTNATKTIFHVFNHGQKSVDFCFFDC